MLNDLIKHQVFIQRYGSGLYNDLLPDLKELRDRISAKIMSSTPYQMERLSITLKEIDTIIASGTARFQPSLWGDFAEYENEFSLKMLDNNTQNVAIGAGLNAEAMAVVIGSSQMELDGKKKLTIAQAIDTFSKRYSKDIKSEIEFGIAEGETTDQIARRIQSLSNNRTRQQAKALVTTITNHVGNEVRSKVWEDYEDLFEGYEYVATLDARTTIICASRDGKIYSADKFPPLPAHWNCRSIKVPKIKAEYSLGIDTTRASMNGQVSSKLTYSGWLKGQSKEVQNEVLGIERAKLFRSGKITLDKFVDDKGKMYSLAQLKKADGIGTVKAVQKIDFGYDGKFNHYVADIRDEAKIVIDKLPKPSIIGLTKNGGSYYEPHKNKLLVEDSNIYFNHEYGHHIDTMIGKKTGSLFYSQSESVMKAMNDDIKLLALDTTKGKQNILKYLEDNHYTKSEARGKIHYDSINDYSNVVSDIFDSMTKGYINGKGLAGHGKSYFKEDMYRSLENNGNMFALWAGDKKEWDRIKELLPNMTKEFELTMKDVIDGKFD